MFHGLRPISRLPDDVLRHLFETASRGDRRTSLTLALVSLTSQHWVDEILYSEVILSIKGTARLFLRTIQTSQLKSPVFFSTTIKSLVICPDMGPSSVARLLSICQGIVNLSYWPLRPSSTVLTEYHFGDRSASPSRSAVLGTPHARHENINIFAPNPQSSILQQIPLPSPRRVSLIFHEEHPISCFRPIFQSSFFSDVTHLSVVNPWEEWTLWVQAGVLSSAIPSLTNIKFEFCVGQEPLGATSPCSRWLRSVTDETSLRDLGTQAIPSPWSNKIKRVADALTDVLSHGPFLEVCVLVLRFDTEPTTTAKFISRLAFPKLPTGGDSSNPPEDEVQKPGFDPRLVFAWEKQPFRYNYAHSAQERKMWKSAEAVAKAQRTLSGYVMLNCDYLI